MILNHRRSQTITAHHRALNIEHGTEDLGTDSVFIFATRLIILWLDPFHRVTLIKLLCSCAWGKDAWLCCGWVELCWEILPQSNIAGDSCQNRRPRATGHVEARSSMVFMSFHALCETWIIFAKNSPHQSMFHQHCCHWNLRENLKRVDPVDPTAAARCRSNDFWCQGNGITG